MKKINTVRKPRLPQTKIDLARLKLSRGTMATNCGSCVIGEFAWGHYKRFDTPRLLTWDEWKYVLRDTFDGLTPTSRVLLFSETGGQNQYNFSAKSLYNMLLRHGCKGHKMIDEEGSRKYNFYQVKVPAAAWKEIMETTQVPPTAEYHKVVGWNVNNF